MKNITLKVELTILIKILIYTKKYQSIVNVKIKIMSDDSPIIQNSIEFFETDKVVMPNVTISQVGDDDIGNFIIEQQQP